MGQNKWGFTFFLPFSYPHSTIYMHSYIGTDGRATVRTRGTRSIPQWPKPHSGPELVKQCSPLTGGFLFTSPIKGWDKLPWFALIVLFYGATRLVLPYYYCNWSISYKCMILLFCFTYCIHPNYIFTSSFTCFIINYVKKSNLYLLY